MSRHNKGRGFSQTSKRFEGDLKVQHRAARNKQTDHSADAHEEASPTENRSSQIAGKKKAS
ncbi:MAG: hypothetical protein ACKOX6_05470 [Bdellovibrio sp.]